MSIAAQEAFEILVHNSRIVSVVIVITVEGCGCMEEVLGSSVSIQESCTLAYDNSIFALVCGA